MNDFRIKLMQLREAAGMTQKELALEVGVAPSTIGHYEIGDRRPRDGVKVEIANIFNLTVEELFFTDRDVKKNEKKKDKK